jgi:hypothetical protein
MSDCFFNKGAAAAIALLSLSTLAHAGDHDECTIATLKGAYGGELHAEQLGILTGAAPNQVLHRYVPPVLIDNVSLATFDGAGTGTQEDFTVLNGVAAGDSFANETLSYTVNADCTGELRVAFPNGNTLTQKFVIADNGNEFFSVTSTQHVASGGAPAHDGTPCDQGCDVAIQASRHSVRVSQDHGH